MREESSATSLSAADRAVPLCVDLDGTLIFTDTLVESLLAVLRAKPAVLFLLPLWLRRGRAHLKQRLAERCSLDAAALPYNDAFVAHLAAERSAGRAIWLVTGAARTLAERVATHLGFFDGVLATDGAINLTGASKLEALKRRFPGGFDYAGNERVDLPIWRAARRAIVVCAPASVAKRARAAGNVQTEFPRRARGLRALALRF